MAGRRAFGLFGHRETPAPRIGPMVSAWNSFACSSRFHRSENSLVVPTREGRIDTFGQGGEPAGWNLGEQMVLVMEEHVKRDY